MRHLASNYHPVSSTDVLCKLLEHIVPRQIMDHYDSSHIPSNGRSTTQFQIRRSCESQLLITDYEVAKSLVLGDQVDIVLLDFSNFDKVTHQRLLHKLHYCIRGKIWNWVNFKDFLAKRTLQVTLQVQSSTRGIWDPQGTMMGPLLFLYPWLARVYFIRCEIIRWWLPALSQK